MFGIGERVGAAQSSAAGAWAPMRHPKDDWFDQIPGKHRLFFDTTTAEHVSSALQFAGNFLRANKDGYGLEDRDVAVVICLRHHATPFAFGDAIWAKYGKPFSDRLSFVDPNTKQPPTTNVHLAELSGLVKRGVHLAVCDMASHAYAHMIAEQNDGDPEAIYKEFVANALGNSHFVTAGIVAVNRAQERGYALCHIG